MAVSPSIPSTMKAWVYKRSGKVLDVLNLENSWPVPKPSSSRPILVKVHAASLNPVGWKTIELFPSFLLKKPAVPEMDFSGVVVGGEGVGSEGSEWKVGDEVFGIIPGEEVMRGGQGTLSEYTTARSDLIYRKPSSVSFEESSGIALVAMTAYLSIIKEGGLKQGGRILINGGSGGVGTWAVQIAKAHGATVVATCSGANANLVKTLGADEIIDYKSVDLTSHLSQEYPLGSGKEFDIVFDAVGSHRLYDSSPGFLKKEGKYVDIGADIHTTSDLLHFGVRTASKLLRPAFLGGTPRTYIHVTLRSGNVPDVLRSVGELFEQGKVKPIVDSVFSFEDAKKAYEKQMSNRAKGKVVVKVAP